MATPTTLPSTFVAGNVLTAAQMNNLRGAFRVLQVVSTTKTDLFSTASTTLVDVTGMTASITPSATSSLVLVMFNATAANATLGATMVSQLVRGSTLIARGDLAGSRWQGTKAGSVAASRNTDLGFVFLDTPATTSATTYKIQAMTSSGTLLLNTTGDDTNAAGTTRTISTLTVMEISA